MLIRDLEKNTGLERATIRFYEKEGLINPIRQENGYREYSQDDCDTLLKVKLLRQLGMPLEMIRGLQQGSEDFSTAISDQINALEHKIQDTGRAKEVCVELRDSGATFEALDAAHYLNELARVRPAEPEWTPQPVPEFRQTVPTHPWRRYFARTIDYSILNLIEMFLLIVVLRIRPVNDFIYTLTGLSIFSYGLWIPIEGVLLHYWGTTLGKWIMGIRVGSVNGGNLSISEAMKRACKVLCFGYGLTIPIYELWRLYKSYKEYVDFAHVRWDQECDSDVHFEYYYENWKKVFIGLIIIAYLFVFGVSMNDSVLSAHRGEDLTIAQVAQNHNDYLETMYDDENPPASMYLNESGCWRNINYSYPSNAVVIGSSAVDGYSDYVYEVDDGGFVRSIIYEQRWTDIFMLTPVGTRQICTVMAVAGAQDWMNYPRFREFADKLDSALKEECGRFAYENLEIVWKTEAENSIFSGGRYYAEDNGKESAVQFRFEIIIHKSE